MMLARWLASHLTYQQILWIRRGAFTCFVLLVVAYGLVLAR